MFLFLPWPESHETLLSYSRDFRLHKLLFSSLIASTTNVFLVEDISHNVKLFFETTDFFPQIESSLIEKNLCAPYLFQLETRTRNIRH